MVSTERIDGGLCKEPRSGAPRMENEGGRAAVDGTSWGRRRIRDAREVDSKARRGPGQRDEGSRTIHVKRGIRPLCKVIARRALALFADAAATRSEDEPRAQIRDRIPRAASPSRTRGGVLLSDVGLPCTRDPVAQLAYELAKVGEVCLHGGPRLTHHLSNHGPEKRFAYRPEEHRGRSRRGGARREGVPRGTRADDPAGAGKRDVEAREVVAPRSARCRTDHPPLNRVTTSPKLGVRPKGKGGNGEGRRGTSDRPREPRTTRFKVPWTPPRRKRSSAR